MFLKWSFDKQILLDLKLDSFHNSVQLGTMDCTCFVVEYFTIWEENCVLHYNIEKFSIFTILVTILI